MKNQFLIALDLDGTLLLDNKTISNKTHEIIQQVKQLGHKVMIATGRPFRASKYYYDELKLNTPIINFNGAHIHHPKDKNWGNYHNPLDLHIAKKIIHTCEHHYKINNIIAEIIDDVYLHYYDEKILEIISMGSPMIQTGHIAKTLPSGPTSILIHPNDEEIDLIRKKLDEDFKGVVDHRKWGAPWNVIEIVKTGNNKGDALKLAANYFGISRENIIAFGDEDNDFEMLEYAGYGIAMENSIDEVKNIANDITLSNEADGVAIYLENFFNLS